MLHEQQERVLWCFQKVRVPPVWPKSAETEQRAKGGLASSDVYSTRRLHQKQLLAVLAGNAISITFFLATD